MWKIWTGNLVLGVEHPNFPSDATAGQDVGLLVVKGEGGPGEGVEVFFDILVLVLHQNCSRVDIDDADAVAAAGCHVRCCFVVVLGVRLEHNLKHLAVKTGEIRHWIMKINPVDGEIFYIKCLNNVE